MSERAMKSSPLSLLLLAAAGVVALACDSCFGPVDHVEHVRRVRRMQPGAPNATCGPARPLEWGQVNVLHTTDTHGWLAGHVKQANYGADWGDFVSFVEHLKARAGTLGVDLLLVDTGDLHDGTGLSDATTPDGDVSNKVFEELDGYDLLTIGNHELYLSNVAYQDFDEFSKFWGDRYLTSNVQILNPNTGAWEYIGSQFKYLTTSHGLRIMALGVLFDFTGNSNVSKVTKAATMVQQTWFQQAVKFTQPIDLFLVLGHNPARPSASASTFGTIYDAIRKIHANTPIQFFGGHSHVRDFAVLDQSSTALESGRYCETVGWLSMSGFDSSNSGFHGATNPPGVPNPAKKATNTSAAPFVYSRRYLDWNRRTFMYHASGTQNDPNFDHHSGSRVSAEIATDRATLKLGTLYGCVPNNYCANCVPFGDPLSIFTVLSDALSTVVVNPARNGTARMVIANTGSVRYDLYKGPFTQDDNFIVSPFPDVFLYIPNVPFSHASTVLSALNNAGKNDKRRVAATPLPRDSCVDPVLAPLSSSSGLVLRNGDAESFVGVSRRQIVETAGYTTHDDFGTDGDDTAHTAIPGYSVPDYFQATGGFPSNGNPGVVDLVFVDFIEKDVLAVLGPNYTASMVTYFISPNFTTQDYLIPYVQDKWQAGMPSCPI